MPSSLSWVDNMTTNTTNDAEGEPADTQREDDTPSWLKAAEEAVAVPEAKPTPFERERRWLEAVVLQSIQLVLSLAVVAWTWFAWAVPAATRIPHPVEVLALRCGQDISEARQLSAASTQLTQLTLRAAPVLYSPEAKRLLVQS